VCKGALGEVALYIHLFAIAKKKVDWEFMGVDLLVILGGV